jgi:hypothetical protein
VQSTGAPTTLAGSPVISAYSGNNTTELTAGITLTVDFDSRTGMHNVRVVASSGNGYATATNYQLVITTGTVNSVSVVGYVIAEFSIENRSALMPTTAARTLDVAATGEAGLDFSNFAGTIGASTLAADTITAAKVASDVTDEIWAKACTEPTAVIAASPTAIAALSWLATLSRNKITQTATTQIIKADDGSTTVATSTVSDDGTTFTRGEFA